MNTAKNSYKLMEETASQKVKLLATDLLHYFQQKFLE